MAPDPLKCPHCNADMRPDANAVIICDQCERGYEKELAQLQTRLVLAKAAYERSRTLVRHLGYSHGDSVHGLELATREYDDVCILYARALIERTRRRLSQSPQSSKAQNLDQPSSADAGPDC